MVNEPESCVTMNLEQRVAYRKGAMQRSIQHSLDEGWPELTIKSL